MMNSPHIPVNVIVVREIFYLKFVSNCSSTYSLNNELSLYYMKHYVCEGGTKRPSVPEGFKREGDKVQTEIKV